jgi:hypothetical protein
MAGKKGMHHGRLNLGEVSIEKIRAKIKTSLILDRIHKHVLGEIEMSPTQMQGAQTLLRKVIPDLSAVEHSGSVDTYTTLLQSIPAEHPRQAHQEGAGSMQQVSQLPEVIQGTLQ